MRNPRMLLATAGVLLVTAPLVACSGSSSGDTDADGITDLTVGVLPTVDVLPLYVGIQEGIFEKHGLNVKPSVAQGGAALIPSVLEGSVPITFTNVISGMVAHEKGLPLEYVASALYSTDPFGKAGADHPASILATAPDSPITSAAQLSGKTVSINALKGIQELAVRNSVDVAGGDSSTVQFLALPLQQAQGALESGQVDAISLNEPFTSAAIEAGDQIVGAPFTDFAFSAANFASYFTSDQYAAENPDVIENFVAALAEASEWTRENEAEAREILLTYTAISEEDAQGITLPYFEAASDPESLGELAELAVEYGILNAPIDIEDMLGDAEILSK